MACNTCHWNKPVSEPLPEPVTRLFEEQDRKRRIAAALEQYRDQCVIKLVNGNYIVTDTYRTNPEGSSYVTVLDDEAQEIAHWVYDEWQDDPQLVMGAILGAAHSGAPLKPITDACPRCDSTNFRYGGGRGAACSDCNWIGEVDDVERT